MERRGRGRSIEFVPTEPDIEKFAAHPREIGLRVEGEGGEGEEEKKEDGQTDWPTTRTDWFWSRGSQVFFQLFSPFSHPTTNRSSTGRTDYTDNPGPARLSDQFKTL